jgi:phosphoglycerol transferase MdoB-like AlkP superfamily enzyme
MGLRYDLRWVSIILLPLVALGTFARLSPFYTTKNKKWWTWYLAIVTFFVFFFFAAGFGNFSYNQTPLDAGAMNFIEDPVISIKMLFQTYPMVWMLLGLIVAVLFFQWIYDRSFSQIMNKTEGLKIQHDKKYFIAGFILLTFFIYGNLLGPPLSREDSFRFKNSFNSYLAINPLQNFFTTVKQRKPEFDELKARKAFPLMATWMNLPDTTNFSFRRIVAPRSNSLESRPNIVLVQCESFSMYKSSMSGNPLNTTPYFDSLCKKGIFFDHCFAPHFSTARALFAILTGIPDAQLFKFSTRNPEALNQHSIVNNFEEYEKHYFLGGSAEFNNFEGLLKNIKGLQMHTEKSFKASTLNVWGISDKDLFLEANNFFKTKDKPFFAYIQTSDNHRPYTIPVSDSDFVRKIIDDEQLKKYGFESLQEYNCFRYSDYCIKKFIEAASKESYFHNTIFIFVGDHGVAGNAEALYPAVWTQQRLTDEHVPLLFFAPYLLEPQKRSEVVSQIDILPTLAGMLQQSYYNTTLGRDLLDPLKKNNYAFITNTAGTIGMVTDDYYFSGNINFPVGEVKPMHEGSAAASMQQQDSAKQALSAFTNAFFETAKYLLMNNKKDE